VAAYFEHVNETSGSIKVE